MTKEFGCPIPFTMKVSGGVPHGSVIGLVLFNNFSWDFQRNLRDFGAQFPVEVNRSWLPSSLRFIWKSHPSNLGEGGTHITVSGSAYALI